jgi:hypothetical protein
MLSSMAFHHPASGSVFWRTLVNSLSNRRTPKLGHWSRLKPSQHRTKLVLSLLYLPYLPTMMTAHWLQPATTNSTKVTTIHHDNNDISLTNHNNNSNNNSNNDKTNRNNRITTSTATLVTSAVKALTIDHLAQPATLCVMAVVRKDTG